MDETDKYSIGCRSPREIIQTPDAINVCRSANGQSRRCCSDFAYFFFLKKQFIMYVSKLNVMSIENFESHACNSISISNISTNEIEIDTRRT